jgi:hypothetical protein
VDGDAKSDIMDTSDPRSMTSFSVCHSSCDLPHGILRVAKQSKAKEVLGNYGLSLLEREMVSTGSAHAGSIESQLNIALLGQERTSRQLSSFPERIHQEMKPRGPSPEAQDEIAAVLRSLGDDFDAPDFEGRSRHFIPETQVQVQVWAGPAVSGSKGLAWSEQLHTKKEVRKLLRDASGTANSIKGSSVQIKPSAYFCLSFCSSRDQDSTGADCLLSETDGDECRGGSLREGTPTTPISKQNDAGGPNYLSGPPRSVCARGLEPPGGLSPIREDGAVQTGGADGLTLTGARFTSHMKVSRALKPPTAAPLRDAVIIPP